MSFTDAHLFFDDVQVGQEWKSIGRTVTEADVVNFAGVSGDFNPIHVDHEYCKGTPFRKPIAHGLLILSISSGLGLWAPPMRTLAFLEMLSFKLLGPVFFGDTIHMLTRIESIEARARNRRGNILWYRQTINQDNKVVQEARTLTIVEGRANIR